MAGFEIFAEDVAFPEGPVACDDGSVIVAEIRRQQVTRFRPDGSRQLIARVEGAPNGLAFGPDGALYGCNNGGFIWPSGSGPEANVPAGTPPDYRNGWIERIELSTGRVERLYEECDGIPLAGPNDIVFDNEGGFWFTDRGKDLGTHELHGGLFHARADGSSIVRVVHALGLNGVGLSPDGRTVYAALTMSKLVLAFDAIADGPVSTGHGTVPYRLGRGILAGRIVASFPGRELLDSMAVEADGKIAQGIVVEGSGIARIDPATGQHHTISFPDRLCTNLAFGGADMRTAFVCLSNTNRIARVPWPAPGLRLPYSC